MTEISSTDTARRRQRSGLDRRALGTLLSTLAAQPHIWSPQVGTDPSSRHWARLPAPADVDLWVLTWFAEQATELHDHRDSAAAFMVVSGQVAEDRVSDSGARSRQRFGLGQLQHVAPYVAHDVRNAWDGASVTLHAYSPPLTEMRYYDAELRVLRTVRTDAPER